METCVKDSQGMHQITLNALQRSVHFKSFFKKAKPVSSEITNVYY